MNIPRFAAIVARIESDPTCWDQANVSSSCGSAHCILGHAQIDAGRPIGNSAFDDAQKWLEVDCEEAAWLCWHKRTLNDFKRVLKTGRVFD